MQAGIDPVVSLNQTFWSLIDYLQDFGMQTLNQAKIGCDLSTLGSYWCSSEDLDLIGDWYMAEELDLVGDWCLKWERYVFSLSSMGLHLTEEGQPGVFI